MSVQSFQDRLDRLQRGERLEVEQWAFPKAGPKPKAPVLPPLSMAEQVRLAPFYMPLGFLGIAMVRAFQDVGGALGGMEAQALWVAIVLYHMGLMSAISSVFFDRRTKPRAEWKLLHALAGYAFGGAMLSLFGM